jgi:hypothetical protein
MTQPQRLLFDDAGAPRITALQLRAIHSLFRVCAQRPDLLGASALPASTSTCVGCPNGVGEKEAGPSFPRPLLPVPFTPGLIDSPTPDLRDQRLALASKIVGRELHSLSDLRLAEASTLIDALKRALGQTVNPPRARRRPDRDKARAYGTAGRREDTSKEIQLVDSDTLALLDNLAAQLGWSPERLSAFLHSPASPVSSGEVRTLPEANRAIWALKNMIRRRDSRRNEIARKEASHRAE